MIVADTHALIWWSAQPARLSHAARAALDRGPIGVPAIVCLEVSLLARRKRIELPRATPEWLSDVLTLDQVELLPITVEVATIAAQLWGTLRDPGDLLIAATALHLGAPLVTKDERIRGANLLETIW